ncbi:MAG: hypothetical protein U0271_40805 [Polyangiaceae bacterium]
MSTRTTSQNRARNSRLGLVFVTLVALFSAGCVVSPQPSPPETDPELDGDGIDVGVIPETVSEYISFDAAPGTVKPAEGVVIVTDLDTTEVPSTAVVRSDGSFSIALPGLPGHTYRFQVKQGDARSQPVDLVVDDTGTTAVLVEEDAPSCLVLDPGRYAPLDGEGDATTLLLRNDCGVPVRIAAPRLRRGQGPFVFSPTGALEIPASEVGFITVRAGGSGAETEDVLLLDVEEPVATRRAITLTIPE